MQNPPFYFVLYVFHKVTLPGTFLSTNDSKQALSVIHYRYKDTQLHCLICNKGKVVVCIVTSQHPGIPCTFPKNWDRLRLLALQA